MKTVPFSQQAHQMFAICLAALVSLAVATERTGAQEGQGVYITQASTRLIKLVNASNADGYQLQDNSFSIGGGWFKQSQTNWSGLFTVELNAGTSYRFLGAGDADAKDVDLQILDASGKQVALDDATNPEAVVDFRPAASGRYVVRIRLYDSEKNLPCVCLAVVMVKR